MVAAVLVCSLSAPCGALYSIQYTSEFADRAEVAATAGQAAAIPRIPPADRARMARRAQFDLLSERLCSEAIHAGAMAGAGRAVDIAIEDQGVFRTAQGAPFTRDAIVHWKRYTSLVLGLVRSPEENAIATDAALTKLGKALLQRFPEAAASPSDLATRPEEITAVLQGHLPNGTPLIMSQSMLDQVSRETDSLLANVSS